MNFLNLEKIVEFLQDSVGLFSLVLCNILDITFAGLILLVLYISLDITFQFGLTKLDYCELGTVFWIYTEFRI